MPSKTIQLDEDINDRIERIKPKFLSVTAYCNLVLSQHICTELANLTVPPLQSPQHSLLGEKGSERDKEGLTGCEADSHKGRERERKGKRGYTFSVPDDLQWCDEKLETFWKEGKKGAKTEHAAKLLFTELSKIESAYGKQVVLDQLTLATANRWESITAANYERFGLPPATAAQALETPKSNAGCYKDWTAERLEREGKSIDEVVASVSPQF